jgi:hypothetical protein
MTISLAISISIGVGDVPRQLLCGVEPEESR